MATAFQYRPRFVDIRVRPPKPDPLADAESEVQLKPGERLCDHAGCRQPGVARAPKSRDMLNEHYWFCQPHAAEYNRTWNFFAGMSEEQIRARQTDESFTGGRPTWSFKAGRGSREAAAAASKGFFRDTYGIFGRSQAQQAASDKAAWERQLGRLERNALADLDLDATADGPLIRRRYTELLKRCHPDANGGDRSAEHKLQRVIKAFRTLQKAKLV
ncbi:MAG TPA: J domain-containing protein [Caulobacteraceae bacterium]|nr:J domain-containing protein [Caulobacteraceae bacterium]